VWKFKEGFGGRFVQRLGAWDYAPSPLLYQLYTTTLPRIFDIMRWRGMQQARQVIAD
jgi:lipid II:glycine glycyltransferase (peptidoglycan interpeptide bridge formation enzyme)